MVTRVVVRRDQEIYGPVLCIKRVKPPEARLSLDAHRPAKVAEIE